MVNINQLRVFEHIYGNNLVVISDHPLLVTIGFASFFSLLLGQSYPPRS